MSRRSVLSLVVVSLIVLLAALPGLLDAQDQPPLPLPTPEGFLGGRMPLDPDTEADAQFQPSPTPEDAGACLVEPRTEEELLELGRIAVANQATPTPIPTPFVLPDGEPADPETIAAITATVAEAIACSEEQDIARYLALFSDAYIVREVFMPDPAPIAPGEPPPATPVVAATPIVEAIAEPIVADVRLLPDGRAVALVFHAPLPLSGHVLFVEEDGRWLIDEVIPVAEVATPAP